MHWFLVCLKKYAVFSGRARRAEYWYFALFYLIMSSTYLLADLVHSSFVFVSTIIYLGLTVPAIAVGTRRLHDTDRSGWWQLLALIPFLGFIVLVIWFIQPGTPEPNRFGDNPKADDQKGDD